MLVDLGRNDIGKISQFGSVEVERYMDVLRYSHVMHIGSTVRGHNSPRQRRAGRRGGHSPRRAPCPVRPKFRACQIINELENNKRGIYGGAIGYIDFTGNLDTCIAIRIAFKKERQGIHPLRRGHRGRQCAGEVSTRSASTRLRPW